MIEKIKQKLKKYWKWFLITICGVGIVLAAPVVPDIALEKMQIAYNNAPQIKAKYKMENASFIREAIDKIAIQIEVGDKIANKFTSQMTIRKWDDEVNFKIKHKNTEKEKDLKFELDGEKIKLKGKKIETHFYEVENAYEYEIILLEKPITNLVEFDIEIKGLNFYYQPELTQEEIDEGAFRPENVIGSYAVYHSTKQGDYSKMDGKNYRAGKAFHIYRPLIIDNAGKEVWGELNITNNLLTVTIPQKFLDNAVYPVRHAAGLTFGYDPASHGATELRSTLDYVFGSTFSASEAGTATSLSFYWLYGATDDGPIKTAIYKRSDMTFLKATAAYTYPPGGSLPAWSGIMPLTSNQEIIIQDYYLAVWGEEVAIAYDSSGGEGGFYSANYPGEFPSPINFPANFNKYSIYATYTAGGAEEEAPVQSVIFFD